MEGRGACETGERSRSLAGSVSRTGGKGVDRHMPMQRGTQCQAGSNQPYGHTATPGCAHRRGLCTARRPRRRGGATRLGHRAHHDWGRQETCRESGQEEEHGSCEARWPQDRRRPRPAHAAPPRATEAQARLGASVWQESTHAIPSTRLTLCQEIPRWHATHPVTSALASSTLQHNRGLVRR